MSFTYDQKSTTALSGDARSSAGSFTNDGRNSGLTLGLWISSVFPWVQPFPWLITTDGQLLVKDARN